MRLKRILFIVNHRLNRSPGQRFRFEQYLSCLTESGFEYVISNFINEEDDKMLYTSGNYYSKLKLERKSRSVRKVDVKRANQFDIIFIYREALLTGSTFFEKEFSRSKAKVVFDFDDAVWLPNVSSGNKILQVLKKPEKTSEIIQFSDMVFAGNSYLADYASNYCKNVKIIPTTIDTEYHKRKNQNNGKRVCIGWTGTQTTLKYLDALKGVFKTLSLKYGSQIFLKVICDQPWEFDGIELKYEKWTQENEIEQLEEIDIGIMPLTDDEWSRGKCGFKGLQYMAMESATIMSPVGVNIEIIENGKNGFLAGTETEWIEQISRLIENKELRLQLGKEGRKTIENKYSVNVFKEKYVSYLNEILEA
jgi:glycosyltransferase involved in cell wall biosynthesis